MEVLNTPLEEIKYLLSNNEIESAIRELKALAVSKRNHENRLIIIHAVLNRIIKKEINGSLSFDDSLRYFRQVIAELLDVIKELEDIEK